MIKESLELLDGLKVVAVGAKVVFKDGKVDINDLPEAMVLLGQLGTITAALQGVELVMPELKDLSADEVNQLIAKVLEIVAAVKAA